MRIGIWQIVIVVLVILLLFGGSKLANLGGNLGKSIRGFKKEMKEMKDEVGDEPETETVASDEEADAKGARKDE